MTYSWFVVKHEMCPVPWESDKDVLPCKHGTSDLFYADMTADYIIWLLSPVVT